MKPDKKAALQLAQDIVRIIHEERLRPGDRYLSEADALKRHGVARATYREALRFLEFQGVVRVKAGPKGGTFVSRPNWTSLASTLALLLQFEDAPLRSILEARTVIDPGLAAMAARCADDAQIAAMAAAIDSAEAAVSDYPAFSAAYRLYWETLALSSHNPLLALLSPALRAIIDSGRFVPDETRRKTLVERMHGLHDAVSRHEEERARQCMAEIEAAFLARLDEGYPQRISQPIAWSDLTLDDPD